MSQDELIERTDLFTEQVTLVQKITDETKRREQFQLLCEEYQDVGQTIIKRITSLLGQSNPLRNEIDKQALIDQFIAEHSPPRPMWTEFLELYIKDSSFRQNFLIVQFLFLFADEMKIPVEDLFLSFQTLLTEASPTWNQFLMLYTDDLLFREWTTDFQTFISYQKRIYNIKLDFKEQEHVESEILKAVSTEVILDAFKDQERLGFIERFMFWSEFLELYANYLSFRQSIYRFQTHLKIEFFENKVLYPTISNEDIETLSLPKWKEYFRENREELFTYSSGKYYILTEFQRFLSDYYEDYLIQYKKEIIETIPKTDPKELFFKTISLGPIIIDSMNVNLRTQHLPTELMIAVLRSTKKIGITNQIFATIKEEETASLSTENIDKQNIVDTFLATLPQDNREDPFWTQFTQLYTNNFSFRVWFRQLQTITAPLIRMREFEFEVNTIPINRILEELNKLHPSFMEETKTSQWDIFLLTYLQDEFFQIKSFEFQIFIAINYRDKHQPILEQ